MWLLFCLATVGTAYAADADGDGVDAADDCNDADAAVFPGADDAPYDGIDADCSGTSDYDADSDGHDSATFGGGDCDDADALTYPGAPDDPTDGVVTDCDPAGEGDADGDGVSASTDCDDEDPAIYPGAVEVWYDGVDQDCDGRDDDQDGDQYAQADDCDDADATAFPDSFRWDAECGARRAWEPAASVETGVRAVKGGGGCTVVPGAGGALTVLAFAAVLGRRRR